MYIATLLMLSGCTSTVEPISPDAVIVLLGAPPVIPQPPASAENLNHPEYSNVESFIAGIEYFTSGLVRTLDGIVEDEIKPTVQGHQYTWDYNYAGGIYRLVVVSGDSVHFKRTFHPHYDSDDNSAILQGWKTRDNRAGHIEYFAEPYGAMAELDWYRENGVKKLRGLLPAHHIACDSINGGGWLSVGDFTLGMDYFTVEWNKAGMIISEP
jgi:hypothetical protein